jgi:hypothetical protein
LLTRGILASGFRLQDHTAADTLLYFCKRLWGQPYVAPIYALLLHRWLLLRKDAGGAVQRQKHVGVLVFGAQQQQQPAGAGAGAARSITAPRCLGTVQPGQLGLTSSKASEGSPTAATSNMAPCHVAQSAWHARFPERPPPPPFHSDRRSAAVPGGREQQQLQV